MTTTQNDHHHCPVHPFSLLWFLLGGVFFSSVVRTDILLSGVRVESPPPQNRIAPQQQSPKINTKKSYCTPGPDSEMVVIACSTVFFV